VAGDVQPQEKVASDHLEPPAPPAPGDVIEAEKPVVAGRFFFGACVSIDMVAASTFHIESLRQGRDKPDARCMPREIGFCAS